MLSKETYGRKGDPGEWVEVRRPNFQVYMIITSFYVSSLQLDVTNAMLKEAFHSFGNLVDVTSLVGKTKQARSSPSLNIKVF